jgi:toxin-antitoxin system PIN domain toxin
MSEPTRRLLLLDVNVLVALSVATHVHHLSARRWLSEVPENGDLCVTTPTTECGLTRLLLNPRVYGHQLDATTVLGQVLALRSRPGWTFLADDSSLADPAISLMPLAGHRQVTDFHLLNLAARHSATLVTFDRRLPTYLDPADRELVEVVPVD